MVGYADDRTASQRWALADKQPGSTFHEIMVLPTFMPAEACPYHLPGMLPGTSALDRLRQEWDFQNGIQNVDDSPGEPIHSSAFQTHGT